MKKIKIILPLTLAATLMFGAVALVAGGGLEETTNVEANSQSAEIDADVDRFQIQTPVTGYSFSVDSTNKKINYGGTWDSSFCSTDQFNTLSKKYTFSFAVNSDHTVSGTDLGLGLNLYKHYEAGLDDHLNFYLVFNENNTISNANIGAYVHGSNKYLAAVEGETAFTECTYFYTLWGVNPYFWIDGKTPDQFIINPQTGFTITYTVERTTYLDTEVDALSFSIDCYDRNNIPAVLGTKKIYVDWCVKAVGTETSRTAIKPKIGLYSWNAGALEYSNIKFHDISTYDPKSELTQYGVDNNTYDFTNQEVTIVNSVVCNSGVLLSSLNNTSQNVEVGADISGVGGTEAGLAVGFSIYYDAKNYANIFLEWGDSDIYCPLKVTAHFIVNEAFTNVCRYAKNPFDNSLAQFGEWIGVWSDYGWSKNIYAESEGSSNLIRSEITSSNPMTVSGGFSISLIKSRITRFDTKLDQYVLKLTKVNSEGKLTNYYTCPMDFDAFTNPNGAGESSLVNVIPSIGLYAVTPSGDSVKFSNIKVNGKKADLSASAEMWASYFGNNIGCDATGATEPTGKSKWVDFETLYNNVSDEGKITLQTTTGSQSGTNIEQQLYTYDYIISKYNKEEIKYENFIGRESPEPLKPVSPVENNEIILFIVLAIILTGASLAAVMVIKKKKKHN